MKNNNLNIAFQSQRLRHDVKLTSVTSDCCRSSDASRPRSLIISSSRPFSGSRAWPMTLCRRTLSTSYTVNLMVRSSRLLRDTCSSNRQAFSGPSRVVSETIQLKVRTKSLGYKEDSIYSTFECYGSPDVISSLGDSLMLFPLGDSEVRSPTCEARGFKSAG